MAIANGGAAQTYATVNAPGTSPIGLGHGDAGWPLDGMAGRYDARGVEDDFTQAGNLFRVLSPAEQQNLFNNLAGPLSQVSVEIQLRQLGHFDKADPACGAGVRAALTRHAAKAELAAAGAPSVPSVPAARAVA